MIRPEVLNLRSVSADGHHVRWGGNEPDPERIPSALQFSTKIPGLFDTLSCSLSRHIDQHVHHGDDLGLYHAVEAYGQGGIVAWEGRQAEHPVDSSARTVSVEAVGWAAHMMDYPGFREIYVDRDPNSWEELSQDQQIVLEALGHPLDKDYTASVRRGGISFTGTTQKLIEQGSQAGLMYRMPSGLRVAKFKYRGTQGGASVSNTTPARLLAGDDDAIAGLDDNYTLTLDDTLQTIDLDPHRKHLMLRLSADVDHTPATGNTSHRYYKAVAVYGRHDLPLRGNDDPEEPQGVLGEDVIRDVMRRCCPLIRLGTIEGTDFVIPHLVFREPSSASDVVQFVNGYYLFDWGVGLGREFFFRNPTHYRRRWVARQSEGATLALEGPQSENSVNGVIVAFTDERGESKMAGPMGSGCDYTSGHLGDTDPDNPVNAAGIPRKWGRLDLGFTTTYYGAIEVGRRWLSEALETPDRGAVVVTGHVQDADTGTFWPVWCVQAGDGIKVADADNRERRIVSTSYAHDSVSLTASLDNLPHQLDAIMERMGVELIGNIATT